jgi:hypothetical protein
VSEAVGIYMFSSFIISIRLIENFELYGFDQYIGYGGVPWDMEFPDPDTGYLSGEILSDFDIGTYGLYKTVNGGESWYTTETMTGPVFYLSFPSARVGYGVGFEHKLWKTEDYGESWHLLDFDFGEDLGFPFFSSNNVGYLGSSNAEYLIIKTTDGGISWAGTEFFEVPMSNLVKIYCINDMICFALTCKGIYKTTNGGGIGTPITSNILQVNGIQFNISPNPSSSFISLSFSNKQEITSIFTTNYLGEKIELIWDENLQADISHLPPGVYVTEIITEKNKGIAKWVKL